LGLVLALALSFLITPLAAEAQPDWKGRLTIPQTLVQRADRVIE